MVKIIWIIFGIIILVAAIRENGGVDGWIEPATPEYQGAIMTCSELAGNREKSDCMAKNCLFDNEDLNSPSCNVY
jgi:hypothetical protein